MKIFSKPYSPYAETKRQNLKPVTLLITRGSTTVPG